MGAVEMNAQEETNNLAEHAPRDIERISSSIAQLTSSSIQGLEGLTFELQELQKFLKAEVKRVEAEIDSALAGIKIIVETVAPFKTSMTSQSSSATGRAVRPLYQPGQKLD